MNNDTAINRISIKHAYQQVTDAIATRIATGQYPCKLPGERDLAEEFGVSYITMRHAMAILRERGLIVSIHGRGTFNASALTGDATDPLPAGGVRLLLLTAMAKCSSRRPEHGLGRRLLPLASGHFGTRSCTTTLIHALT